MKVIEERIKEYLRAIDLLGEEIKQVKPFMDGLEKQAKEEDANKLQLAKQHFANQSYISMVYTDISRKIAKLSETIVMAELLDVKYTLSEADSKAIEGYMAQMTPWYVYISGKDKIEPIHPMYSRKELLTRCESITDDAKFLHGYFEKMEELNQNK